MVLGEVFLQRHGQDVRRAGQRRHVAISTSPRTFPLGDFVKELTGFTFIAHWGKQKYRGTDPRNFVGRRLTPDNDDLFSYKDWKIGLSYALPKDFTIGAFYSDYDSANVLGYGSVRRRRRRNRGPFPRNIAKGTGTVFIQKTF